MRVRFVVILAALSIALLALRVGADEGEKSGPTAGNKTTADDAAVISAALQYFTEQTVMLVPAGPEKKTVAIHKESAGPSPLYLSDG
jgi:hypothetical protein